MVSIQKELIADIQSTITPAVALAIKYRLKISNNRYDLLRNLLTKMWDSNLEEWVPRMLKKVGLKMPSLFPSLKRVKKFKKKLKTLNETKTQDER